ncbi:LIM and SH3 domain protein F42H10.3-like isoform X2 [Physella acuta]|uniref:LIM and SH3 domain protein F42H10.3-like isoform X2 n=1 Tax=Physella acuta TaxID=109671 RepID=UPI0027DC32D7|nr:LIM and SH3 domain protein F42H10.3-like isoform X2 [Physella acuta]
MNKKCAKCLKTVYPTEELKCLDKIWHKLCFKCEVCGMTLNMKNYKGYEKLPYCNAHYPTTKPTAVADTPESRRIAENTKIQSQVQYHAEFEKQKGFKTSVADDPETSRIKQNTQIQSNVNYWGLKEQREQMEGRRPNESVDDVTRRSRNPGKISDYDPTERQDFDSPYTQRNSANVVYDSQRGEGDLRSSAPKGNVRPSPGGHQPFSYGGGTGAPPPGRGSQNRSSYEEDGYAQQRPSYGEPQQQPYSYAPAQGRNSFGESNPSPRSSGHGVGSVEQRNSYASNPSSGSGYGAGSQGYGEARTSYKEPTPQAQPPRAAQAPPKKVIYRALYDYSAADSDEVSFQDGDHIVDVEVVDAGWMIGTVQRTGQHGMLPSNYVERIN